MIRLLQFVLLTFAAVQTAHADEPIDFTPIEPVLKDELKANGIPGAVVVIVCDNAVAYAKGFGFASIEEKNPVTPDHLFRIGSTTKMFVGMALVKLAEAGKLKLDEPVGKLIEGLPAGIAALTAHQLLTHTAGLADDSVMFGKHDDESLGAEIKTWTDNRFFTTPGDVYSYANPGYWLAGYVAEKAAGKPFADVLADNLFVPLGMKRTTFRPTLAMTYPLAQGHDLRAGQPAIIRPAADNVSNWPAGSLFTSGNDLSRFVIAFLHEGKLDGKQVLSESLVKTVATPHVRVGSRDHYGYGLQITSYRGMELVAHGGARSGFGSRIVLAPKQKIGFVLLMNRTGATLPKTEAKILELTLPLKSVAASNPPKPVELNALAGAYRNGESSYEFKIIDGQLNWIKGTNPTLIRPREDGRLSAASGEIFEIVTGNDKTTTYLMFRSRAYKKQ